MKSSPNHLLIFLLTSYRQNFFAQRSLSQPFCISTLKQSLRVLGVAMFSVQLSGAPARAENVRSYLQEETSPIQVSQAVPGGMSSPTAPQTSPTSLTPGSNTGLTPRPTPAQGVTPDTAPGNPTQPGATTVTPGVPADTPPGSPTSGSTMPNPVNPSLPLPNGGSSQSSPDSSSTTTPNSTPTESSTPQSTAPTEPTTAQNPTPTEPSTPTPAESQGGSQNPLTPDFENASPGRATRSGSSYIGIGGNIGVGDTDSSVGDTSFSIISKIGLTTNLSIRPTLLVQDDPSILIPLTLDFFPGVIGTTADLSADTGLRISPYVGLGLALETANDGNADFLLTGGVDIPITSRFTGNIAVNATFFNNTAVGVLIGVGYNFR